MAEAENNRGPRRVLRGGLSRAPIHDESYDGTVRFEVLGPMRAVAKVGPGASAMTPPTLGGPKQRLVFALLLSEPNTVLTVDRLIDGIWADDPPATARHTLQGYVSELRKEVGSVIERRGSGYLVHASAGTLDVLDFESRVSSARTKLESDPGAAVGELDAALALWRGDAYQDFLESDGLDVDRARLNELRLIALEDLMRGRLALGQHADVVAQIDRLTRDHPYREELRALHMLALYRSGRQADALRAYRQTREALGEGLGIDPSPRLRRLEEKILLQDPDLERAPPAGHDRNGSRVAVENPYVGLGAFHEQDESRFFGREDLVERLIERVRQGCSLTGVVGPSGSGKSSAVLAGLVPRLRREFPELLVTFMQPGVQPFAELDAALERVLHGVSDRPMSMSGASLADIVTTSIPDGSRLILIIDQFEELYLMAERTEAVRFLSLLVSAVDDRNSRIHVIVTLRADFYDRPLSAPDFGPMFADNVVNVVPLSPDQLESAAILPARQADVDIEPRLLGRLLSDVAGQPNALPLFQYALTELFDERAGPTLDLATYERIGGVRKSVARRAESLFVRFDAEEQEAARQLFLRIATVSDDIVGRRRVPASELVSLDVDIVALNTVIDQFSRYRLVALDRDPATSSPTIQIAHEALFDEWHRLRGWIDECRDDLRTHASFVITVTEWERSAQHADYLLAGSRLKDYEDWAAMTRLRLTAAECSYLQKSVAARERSSAASAEEADNEARRQKRSHGQLLLLFATAAVLAAVTLIPMLSKSDQDTVVLALLSPTETSEYSQLLVRGLTAAGEHQDVKTVLLEPPLTADVVSEIRRAAEDGAALVISDASFAEELIAIAPDYPNTTFWGVDYFHPSPPPNYFTVGFEVAEGAFLVGATAALETQTDTIGYIGANAQPFVEEFRAGFEQGARSANPDIEIVSRLISPPGPDGDDGLGGFSNPGVAEHLAREMYLHDNVDVIFAVAGESGFGVIDAAAEHSTPGRHLWAIGVDSDRYHEVSIFQQDHVLTSMLKRLDTAVEVVTARRDDPASPADIRLTLNDGGVGYATSGDHLRATTIATLEDRKADIIAGAAPVHDVPSQPLDAPPIAFEGRVVTFDGTTCSYDGPDSFELDTVAGFRFVNASSELAWLMVSKVGDGVTLEQITTPISSNDDRFASGRTALPREEFVLPVAFDTGGDWLLSCLDSDLEGGPVAIVHVATA